MSADGLCLYAASAAAGYVLVIARDLATGGLRVVQSVRDDSALDGRLVDALAGARALALTPTSLYVAAHADSALSAFSVSQVDGTLSYVDRIRAGERLIGRFAGLAGLTSIASDPNGTMGGVELPPSFLSSDGPRKLVAGGEGAGQHPWASEARRSVLTRVAGVLYMAVVSAVKPLNLKP